MGFDYRSVRAYYREFLAEHHDDARKVAWRSPAGQRLRFENLLEAWDEPGPTSILDVGCGLGDLLGYLNSTGREVKYTGIDIVPEMIERAKARYPDGTFAVCDLLETTPPPGEFDLVVASGALTVRVPKHVLFVEAMLKRMLAVSTGAVAVNFQSTRAFRHNPLAAQDPDLYHVDPLEVYALCRRLCRWTTLREDMLVSDVVVYMYPGYARSTARLQRLAAPAPEDAAWLLLERRLPEQALALLCDAPPNPMAANLQGVAHQQLGDREEAARQYRRALEMDPEFTPARLNLEGITGATTS